MDTTTIASSVNSSNIDWSLIISIISLTWGAFTFWFYDRKTKRQDAKINEYTLSKIEAEKTENKKALVRANIIKEGKGNRRIKIYNSGKSEAYNVRLEFTSDMKAIYYRDNIFPYEKLLPQDSTSITLQLYIGASDKLSLKLTWDDNFQKDNENTQILTLI